MIKLGILRRGDNVARAIWSRLPSSAQWALLARRGKPELVELGDLWVRS